jgi:alpha-galactosidase
VAFAWQLADDAASGRKPLTVAGLAPDRTYLLKEVNLKPGMTSRLPENGQTFTGAHLMSKGIALGFEKQFDSAMIELIAN